MTEKVKTLRHRWPWVIALALLLLGAPMAWNLRPLTRLERDAVGTWRFEGVAQGEALVLHEDRSYSIWLKPVGSWRESNGRITLTPSQAHVALRTLFESGPSAAWKKLDSKSSLFRSGPLTAVLTPPDGLLVTRSSGAVISFTRRTSVDP
jgi:hypothetical protein